MVRVWRVSLLWRRSSLAVQRLFPFRSFTLCPSSVRRAVFRCALRALMLMRKTALDTQRCAGRTFTAATAPVAPPEVGATAPLELVPLGGSAGGAGQPEPEPAS